MTGDEFGEMLRRAMPAPEIDDRRVEALIEDTLLRAQAIPQSRSWLFWPRLLPVMQYALPMLVAVVMGVVMDTRDANELPVSQFSTLLFSSSLLPSGS